jgi:hypothetical protein
MLTTFKEYCDNLGVQRHLAVSYSPPNRMGWKSTAIKLSSARRAP